ncbi:3'-5' exonuclease [Denitratisoma sp. agr-D3]
MTTYAVIDFETTGVSPGQGARPTEIGIVLVRDGQLVDRYQSLMNPGQPIPWQIQQLTGITDAMVRQAPAVAAVMAEAADFVGQAVPVAHNAAFDRKFWQAELAALGLSGEQEFLCSLLLARRVFPLAPNHKLASLVEFLGLPLTGRYHRALADAEATAHLFVRIKAALRDKQVAAISPRLLAEVQRLQPKHLSTFLQGERARGG